MKPENKNGLLARNAGRLFHFGYGIVTHLWYNNLLEKLTERRRVQLVLRKIKMILECICIFVVCLVGSFLISSWISGLLTHGASLSEPEIEVFGVDESIQPPVQLVPSGSGTLPEECLSYSPYVVNTGKSDCCVFMTVEFCVLPAKEAELKDGWSFDSPYVPLYVYEVNPPWVMVEETVADGRITRVYVYPDAITPGERTVPLCDYGQLTGFSMKTYAAFTDETMGIHGDVFASSMPEIIELPPAERWEKMKQMN